MIWLLWLHDVCICLWYCLSLSVTLPFWWIYVFITYKIHTRIKPQGQIVIEISILYSLLNFRVPTRAVNEARATRIVQVLCTALVVSRKQILYPRREWVKVVARQTAKLGSASRGQPAALVRQKIRIGTVRWQQLHSRECYTVT